MKPQTDSWLGRWRRRAPVALFGALAGLVGGCDIVIAPATGADPFAAAPRLMQDGTPARLSGELALLGDFALGDCLSIEATGEALQDVLILVSDIPAAVGGGPADTAFAFLAGGGPAGQAWNHPILRDGRYYLLLQYDAGTAAASRRSSVTFSACSGDVVPQARQRVRIVFAEGFLSEPGLLDALDGTDDERALLESIEPLVREEIVTALRERFAPTPIEIIEDGVETEGLQTMGNEASVLHFLPDRVLAEMQDVVDTTMTPPDSARPQCQSRVVFGEVLPRGSTQDVGNRVRDDQANVYVGSFQGRGSECRTAVTDSVGNIVQALSQTAAHEIGHLVGLHHVEQMDIMNRSATAAFFRELPLGRGQLQSDRVADGVLVGEVLTGVVQDPSVYFASVFAAPADPRALQR